MEYKSRLKPNAWIDVFDLAEWLKIKKSIDVSADKALLAVGDLTFTFLLGGVEGNSYKVELEAGGTAGSETVTQNDNTKIKIQIEDGVSTAQQIKDAFDAYVAIPNTVFVSLAITGTAGNPQAIAAEANLATGTDPNSSNAELVRKLERMINFACAKIEAIIDTVVIGKEFQEDQDGNSSNVIVPGQWPIQKVNEIRIDYNRGFSDPTILEVENYFNRGTPDRRQEVNDTLVAVIGNDIVLRDDNEKFIVGRIFAGSSLGSIRMKYEAGWARKDLITKTIVESEGYWRIEAEDVPQDLVLAATQLAEWFYYQRENRDLGVSGKGVVGENYTKTTDGIPNQIHELIEQYTDCSFGTHNYPQRNLWGFDDL